MSTPVEFDVKNRIATGLSIQGAHITRNVITLVVMLAVGIAIFNYTMKVLVYMHLASSYPHTLTPSHPHTLNPHTLASSHPHILTLTSSHPYILTLTPSHPYILTPSHPHTLTSSHPHTLTSYPSSHPHTLTSYPSSHPHTLTPSHPHTLTPSHPTHPHIPHTSPIHRSSVSLPWLGYCVTDFFS